MSILAVLSCAGLIYAQDSDSSLELEYPTLGGMQGPQSTSVKLTTYIRYLYNFAIISGGLIALLSLIYGGFRFLTSTGNPAAITDARGQILAGFLGLVVILGSYIILNELNPDLISLRTPGITKHGKGIILYNQANCGGLGDYADTPETTDNIPDGLLYKAINSSGSATLGKNQDGKDILPVSLYSFQDSEQLIIQFYANEDCKNNVLPSPKLQANQCLEIDASNVKCIKFIWYKPGVWVFNRLDDGGSVPDPGDLPLNWEEGKDYIVVQGNQDSLPDKFSDKVLGIAIVPSKESRGGLGQNYGVIAHNMSGGISEEKGWAHIYLPGCGSTKKCKMMRGEITVFGPFYDPNKDYDSDTNNYEFSHISSLTIFNVPKTEETSSKEIKVCRQDRCEPQWVGDKSYDVSKTYSPASGLREITGTFGKAVSPYNPGKSIIYGISFEGVEWDGTNKAIAIREHDPKFDDVQEGVSAIEIDEGAHYLLLLYEHFIDDFSKINENVSTDAAIINISQTSLRTIQMNDRVGTIIVIRTEAKD